MKTHPTHSGVRTARAGGVDIEARRHVAATETAVHAVLRQQQVVDRGHQRVGVDIAVRRCGQVLGGIIRVAHRSVRTARHDHLTKRALYERAGVREYWLVHPVDRVITVYTLKDGQYGGPEIADMAGERAVPGAQLGLVSGFGMVTYDRCLCTGAVLLGRPA